MVHIYKEFYLAGQGSEIMASQKNGWNHKSFCTDIFFKYEYVNTKVWL